MHAVSWLGTLLICRREFGRIISSLDRLLPKRLTHLLTEPVPAAQAIKDGVQAETSLLATCFDLRRIMTIVEIAALIEKLRVLAVPAMG